MSRIDDLVYRYRSALYKSVDAVSLFNCRATTCFILWPICISVLPLSVLVALTRDLLSVAVENMRAKNNGSRPVA